MKCAIALNINEGQYPATVEQFGAKTIASNSTAVVHPRDLSVKNILPTVAQLENSDNFTKAASYIFTNSKPTSTEGLRALGAMDDPEAMNKLIASGANLFKDIADNYFGKTKTGILSPNPGNTTQIIVEKTKEEKIAKSDDRSFLRFTSKDMAQARAIIDREFSGESEEDSAISKDELFKEGMEFLLISAMYRGYDIAIDDSFDSTVVDSAIKRYNKHLKADGKKVVFASTFRTGNGIMKINSVSGFLNDMVYKATKSKSNIPATSINDTSLFLSNMLSEDDRKTFDLHKTPSLTSRLVVAHRVVSIFQDMMPNLKAKILSPEEISIVYGPSFENKKGFIIDGTIVLNHDRFDSTTVFHEFGHYYARWLSEYNPSAHAALMENVQNTYEEDIPWYSSMYSTTGLKHSETDVIEEVFVDQLGLAAAKNLEKLLQGINPQDNLAIAKSVDDFTEDFLRKLTKNRTLDWLSTGFTVDSTVADIFNIGMKYSTQMNPTSLAVFDEQHMKSFKDFFIQKASAKEIFQGLITKGMILSVGDGNIILMDELGNRMNTEGEQDSSAVYKLYPLDTVENIQKHNDFLVKAEKYLDLNKNFASVKFSVSHTPTDAKAIIEKATGGLELVKEGDKSYYQKNNIKLDRVTHYLQEQFSGKADSEMFILNSMYADFNKNYIDKAKKDGKIEGKDLSNEAFEATKAFIENDKTAEYKFAYKLVANKFEFKTQEGTYLHGIAETFFRALNYANTIEYKGGKKSKSLLYFADHIRNGIGSPDTVGFDKYFQDFFWDYLKGQENTPEYIAFKENVEFLRKAMIDRAVSSQPAMDFVRLLIDDVVPAMNKLRGPITIMPEVKLSSATLGVAGTIDLIVIDGEGRAHIFDYKTKELGKRMFWDWKGGTNMKGVMSPYKENAMMKASIQTSIYKLMLMELGIQTGQTSVFYVENSMGSYSAEELAHMDRLRYKPKNITKEGLIDVSAELLQHFIAAGRKPRIAMNTTASQDIKQFMFQASGGRDIDAVANVEERAKKIYATALRKLAVKGEDPKTAFLIHNIAKKTGTAKGEKAKGLEIKLPGKVIRNLDGNLRTEDEHIAAIVEILNQKEYIRSVGSTLDTLFNGQDRYAKRHAGTLKSNDKEAGLRALIRGTDSSSHDLVRLASDANYGTEFSNIQMLTNKVTGETRLIVINHDDNPGIDFGGSERNNVHGKYLTNNGARIVMPTVEWRNGTHNMRLIKAGLVMIQQKIIDPTFSVSTVISNPGLDKFSYVPNLHDVATILLMTKQMIESMKKAGEDVPESVLNMLKRPELFESKTYVKNPIEALTNFLAMTSGDYLRLEDMFTTDQSKKNKKALKAILESYDPNQDSHKLIDALHDFRNSMSSKLKDAEAKYNNDLWTLTDHVIMHLMGFNHTINPKDASFVTNFLFATSRMGNKYGASFNRKIQGSAVDIRSDFMVYKNEHSRLIDALALSKGVNIKQLGPALYKSSMKEIYKDLYTTDNQNRATAFILKDPSQVNSQAEKDYLMFIKKTSQQFADMSVYHKVEIPYGWMPLVGKSKASASVDTDPLTAARESVKQVNMNRAMKDDTNKRPIDDEFSTESVFSGQLPTPGDTADDQFTFGRRSVLSVTDTGEDSSRAGENPISRIEDNIENAMDAFVLAALDTYHYKDVSEFGRALFYTIKRHETLSMSELNGVIDSVSLIQRRVINHQESDGSNKMVKSLNKFVTNAAIAGTVSQALLETFTNPLVTTANYVGDKLYGVLFKGTREFSAKSYAQAFKLVALTYGKEKEVIEAIDRTYGIATSDTAALKEMMNKLESKNIFQSKNLMFVNKIMMESWQKITLVAYMLEQGTFYAHSIDEEGNLKYDEKKDKRFHFANAGASDDIVKDRKKFYDATKAEMAKQRYGLNQDSNTPYEERTMKRAWTTFDANHVKEIIVELYSSLDDTSKSLATYYTYMGFIAKMRTWLFSKTARYFAKPMTAEENESASRLVKVMNEDGTDYRYEWKGSETEGILYTVYSMAQQFNEHKMDVIKNGTLNEKQKKNVSMLMGDLLIFSIMGAAASGIFAYALDDETRDDEMVKLIYQRWTMATSDVFVMKSIYDMTTGTGSMMIGVSVGAKFVNTIVETAIIAPQVMTNPDVTLTDLYDGAAKIATTGYGPFRTVALIKSYVAPE